MRGDEGLYLCCQPCSSGPLSPVTRTLFSAISTSPPVLPEAHGGGLDGFFLLRGDQDRLARIRISEEFERLTVRSAHRRELRDRWRSLGGRLMSQLSVFGAQVEELT